MLQCFPRNNISLQGLKFNDAFFLVNFTCLEPFTVFIMPRVWVFLYSSKGRESRTISVKSRHTLRWLTE
jgi:hypothetical protein